MSLVNIAQVKDIKSLKDDVQKMLTSYDASKVITSIIKASADENKENTNVYNVDELLKEIQLITNGLSGASIVSQQMNFNGYIKYGNGLAIIWGAVNYHVSKWENSLADDTNKLYEYVKSDTLPVTVNRIYRMYVSTADVIGKGYGEHASAYSSSGSHVTVTMHTVKPVTGSIQINYFLIGSWN